MHKKLGKPEGKNHMENPGVDGIRPSGSEMGVWTELI